MSDPIQLPKISKPLMGGFQVFAKRYLRKHFHTLAVNQDELAKSDLNSERDALVIYANHASWWDPMLAIFLGEKVFGEYRLYAPIDSEAFEKYRMFGQMGFYPVDQSHLKGAGNFLRISHRILSESGTSIWITPEGHFCDVREHSTPFMPGIGHIAARFGGLDRSESEMNDRAHIPTDGARVWFIPLATEYVFWEERLPEILARFGPPLLTGRDLLGKSKDELHDQLHANLRQTQTRLAEDSIARNTGEFTPLLHSRAGTFFLYDWWRSLRSRLRGQKFEASHGHHWQSEDGS